MALVRAVAATAGLLLAAVLLRREDLVVLAVPIAVGAAVGLAGRPRTAPRLQLAVPRSALLEGAQTVPSVVVLADEPPDLVTVELAIPRWLVADGAPLARAVAVPAGEPVRVPFPLRSQRWGRRMIGPAALTGSAAYGLLRCGPYLSAPGVVTVWPLRAGFDAVDAVPRAEGLVGPHQSRRFGSGSDIAGVRPFAPGDRLRRINWRVSARADRLHVTATYSDRDAEVLLCLDSGHDLGEPPASSLDTAVRAAAAIAEHYLRHGDRVGLLDLGRLDGRRVPAGNGRAHLVRLLDVLLDARGRGRQEAAERRSVGRLLMTELPRLAPRRALLIALTPLAGEAIFEVLGLLGRNGSALVVVDTMPADVRPEWQGEWTDLAFRLWRLERDAGIGRLGALGVPVVPWLGAGSLDAVLRDVSQTARAPRLAR
ncbi:MAG: hypothetical protein V7637_5283 [Mycobacteriales bacterium]|jgi:uncharacterized protein (DUF58 family)